MGVSHATRFLALKFVDKFTTQAIQPQDQHISIKCAALIPVGEDLAPTPRTTYEGYSSKNANYIDPV